jgi:acyl-CoA thioester hydrolase
MNDAAYARVFSMAVDALMDCIGLDDATRRASGRTIYTLQVMLHYFREAKLGDRLSVAERVLEHDDKRLRVWLEMARESDGERVAASEQLLLSVDLTGAAPRAVSWRPETLKALAAMAQLQVGEALPVEAGQGIRLRRPNS